MTTITPLLRVKERIVGPRGLWDIDNEWYGYADEFRYTIGLPGLTGFGVGCCPPELLPSDMALLPGTEDRFSANYGNYVHVPSASIVCFIPAHYIDLQTPGTGNDAFLTRVVISSTQSGNSVLAKAFRNGGSDLAGVFVDKYQGSNCRPDGSGRPNSSDGLPGTLPSTGGIFASRPLHWPVSAVGLSTTLRSSFSLCNSNVLNPAITVAPANNYGGAWQLCQTRGVDWYPVPMWTRIHLGYLALAHAQALLDTGGTPITNATANAAWMDTAPYAPKGNNNNAGADVNKTSLVFSRTDVPGANVVGAGFPGEASRAFTGAARIGTLSAVEQTTHNGQLCGIVDVNGNQWDITPGLTNNTGTNAGYKAFSDLDDYTTVSSNAGITGAANVISLAVDAADDGVWWTGTATNVFLIPNAGGTFHPSSTWAANTTRKAMAEFGLPREAGTSLTQTSTNIWGGDRFLYAHVNNLLPICGGTGTPGGRRSVLGPSQPHGDGREPGRGLSGFSLSLCLSCDSNSFP
jgi:hypothetical protein